MDKYHIEGGEYCTDDHLCRCPRCRPYQQDEYEAAMAEQASDEPWIDDEEFPETEQCWDCGDVYYKGTEHVCEPYNEYMAQLSLVAHEVSRSHQGWELGGCDGPSPYEQFQEALEHALENVKMLRTHHHHWSENDYCLICGADGRA